MKGLNAKRDAGDTTLSVRDCILVLFCVVVFVALRLRWVGHLLTWDEAMNLCSIRSFVSPGRDAFSFWFWRHPPLLFLLSVPLAPLQGGFAERIEMLSVGVGVVTIVTLFLLNREAFGTRVAVWACFLLSIIPSSMFYDVWLKRDAPVALFGLAALLFIVRRRVLLAGVCLGFALLSKETAVFYVVAALLLWLLGGCSRRRYDLVRLLGVPFLMTAWWYIGLKSNVDGVVSQAVSSGDIGIVERVASGVLEHIQFAVGEDRWTANWQGSWHYYISRLPHDLGWVVLVLAAVGMVATIVTLFRCRTSRAFEGRCGRGAWPLLLLLPALLLLSALPGKVPWVPICLYPAWATLGGIGIVAGLRRISSSFVAKAVALAIVGLGLTHAVCLDYRHMLEHDGSRQLVAARNSRQVAEALNTLVSDSDRVLVTSFHHWKGPLPGYVCPVFTAYLERKPAILVKSHLLTFEEYIADIGEYRIDWIVLSPPPGPDAEALFDRFRSEGLIPCRLDGAFIFRAKPLYDRQ